MNWGGKIVLAFVAFAGVLFTMVYISMNQEVNLVADDYYKQEIAYEEQIQRIRNTKALEEPPRIVFMRTEKAVRIEFPEQLRERFTRGEVILFRPSDRRLDVKESLTLTDGVFEMSTEDRVKGLWEVKLTWSDANNEYYDHKQIII